MVRVVGKEGASGAGVGGNCSSGMGGSRTITRRYPGRGSVCYSGRFRYWVGRLSKRERGKKKEGGGGDDYILLQHRPHELISPGCRDKGYRGS